MLEGTDGWCSEGMVPKKILDMKRKTIGIFIAALGVALAGGTGWILRELPQKRLLGRAEEVVFTDADSAARLLAQLDTARLTEALRMRFDLMRALVYEERRYLRYADTTACISSVDSTILVSDKTHGPQPERGRVWNFKRTTAYQHDDDKALLPDSNALVQIHHYYEHASLGGMADDKDALRRYGRICLVLSRNNENAPQLRNDRLLHLAIHCAEGSDDHALAYRAYRLLGQRSENVMKLLCYTRALEHYRLSPDHTTGLLTLLNDYGLGVLWCGPFDLHRFPTLERAAAIAARHDKEQSTARVCDSVFLCLDSLWALPAPNWAYAFFKEYSDDGKYSRILKFSVHAGMYEDAKRKFQKDKTGCKYKTGFDAEWEKTVGTFDTAQDTYLAAGYAMKTAALQRHLMTAVIVILLLSMLLLALLFRNWQIKLRQRHEAERSEQQRKTEQLAERLRQKDAVIAMLRGHIMDKSEIVDMLEPTAGKRTIINARNWREIEMTLDTADGNFVSRLRAEHPEFDEDEIRLCMLSRLKLSNTALSAIYLISVSAVQHRKQKLKKDGFGITDPAMTFDQIIANY